MENKKVIIVTGGSGLLGKSIISDLSSKGYIVINFDINVESNLTLGNLYCDVTSPESIISSIQLVFEKFGRVDGLVNNAYPRTKNWGDHFEVMDYQSLKNNIEWQLNSYIVFCQECLKLMKIQTFGSIVNIASIYGVVGNDFTIYENTSMNPPAAYSAIKGGLISITRYLASLYGSFNVRVNCISPGGIFDNQPDKFVEAYVRRVPMRRMANPQDVSPAVSFFLSDESKYITGQNLIIDGGWTSI